MRRLSSEPGSGATATVPTHSGNRPPAGNRVNNCHEVTMSTQELIAWGRRYYPLTTNIQSLRWLYEWPQRINRQLDAIEARKAPVKRT